MKGCLDTFIALVLATLAAMVAGFGVCMAGLGVETVQQDMGMLVMIAAFPVMLIAFFWVLIKWLTRRPDSPPPHPEHPETDTASNDNQNNE